MATRVYLPSTGAAGVSPAYGSAWEDTTSADRLRGVLTRISSAMATRAAPEPAAMTTTAQDVLVRQYVLDPMDAQTLSGTVTGQHLALLSASSGNHYNQLVLRVVSQDGATERAVLYGGDTSTSNPGSASEHDPVTTTNRTTPRLAVSPGTIVSYGCAAGDRLVIELGYREFNTSSTTHSSTFTFGDDAASDLAVDETTTTQNNPWVELSMNVSFPSAFSRPSITVAPPYASQRAGSW